MKPERHIKHIVIITFLCVIAIASKAQLQEIEPTDFPASELIEITSSETEEKASKLLSNPEKDSISPRPVTLKTKLVSEPNKSDRLKEETKEEDSILSFNFIYYIIKKFKLSDIIDK